MRIPIALVAVATLAPVLFLTGCGGASGLPASEPASSAATILTHVSAAPVPVATPVDSPAPSPVATTAAAPAAASAAITNQLPIANHLPVSADPVPPSPVSTGLIHVTTWKGVPAAKSVFVGDRRIVAFAPDGHALGNWPLPGNLPAIIAGLTTAFGHSPLAAATGTWGWSYTWDGFVIHDYTPEVAGPTDPPYQWDVTVSHVDGVRIFTNGNISVGQSGDRAAAIADATYPYGGIYVAEIAPVPLSVPTTGSPRLWVEVTGGAIQHDPITELRGPVGSWLG